jgi:hypothetical protein
MLKAILFTLLLAGAAPLVSADCCGSSCCGSSCCDR